MLDIERGARFLPGAKIEHEQDVYQGGRPDDRQLPGHRPRRDGRPGRAHRDTAVEAKDTKGQGTATATIRNRLVPHDDGTRVIAETDPSITGRQAHFAHAIMQDVAGRMLDDFARRFEDHLLHGEEAGGRGETARSAGAFAATAQAAAPAVDEGALDLGSALSRTPAGQRAGPAVLGGLLPALRLLRGWRSFRRL
jgi:hypothetical protein